MSVDILQNTTKITTTGNNHFKSPESEKYPKAGPRKTTEKKNEI